MSNKIKTIQESLVEIQSGLAVGKGQYNEFSKFNFRNAEDILKAVKPLLHGCSLVIDNAIVMVGDRVYVEATAILSNKSESLSAKAYAREPRERKGMDASQITGSATSYAKKYALGGLFAIDNEADADSRDNTDIGDFTDAITAINECTDLQALGAVWKSLSKEAHVALVDVKDNAKERLAA
ncbi:MAG TPA: single-stranded DNA-binding protein [Candidatus Thioglobus sp.]|nr:single-stranded DNA-binding protein [Candidatus Thioglobus sp.]